MILDTKMMIRERVLNALPDNADNIALALLISRRQVERGIDALRYTDGYNIKADERTKPCTFTLVSGHYAIGRSKLLEADF